MAHKRSVYLINPKFQLKTTFFICSLVLLASIPYPFIIFWLVDSVNQLLASGAMTKVKNLAGDVESRRTSVLLFLVLWELGFILIVFIVHIFQTHKIAGPMYKLRTYFQKIINGESVDHLVFRKGDHFHEVADDFNKAFKALRDEHKKDFEYLNEINNYVSNLVTVVPEDKKPILTEISTKIAAIQNRHKSN